MTIPESKESNIDYRWNLVWFNVWFFSTLHIATPYALYLLLTSARLYTTIFALVMVPGSLLGIFAGVHRLWSHRAYKASLPLRIFLMIMSTVAFQGSIFQWARDHRIHHKYTDTDGDPHNSNRGFFFSHVGWLVCKKHPEVIKKGKLVELEDLLKDPVVTFQRKYYYYFAVLMCFIVPTAIPVYLWNETWRNAFFVAAIFRYVASMHATMLVNSAAHIYGGKPYDKNINPAENKLVAFVSCGEGWHNYHHVFPWDYKIAEVGVYRYNLACAFIDFCAFMGWAYDLKTVPADSVRQRVQRTGDGTHPIWGWGDKDQTQKERDGAIFKYIDPQTKS